MVDLFKISKLFLLILFFSRLKEAYQKLGFGNSLRNCSKGELGMSGRLHIMPSITLLTSISGLMVRDTMTILLRLFATLDWKWVLTPSLSILSIVPMVGLKLANNSSISALDFCLSLPMAILILIIILYGDE